MITLEGRKQDVAALTFSPDGRKLAVGGTASHVQLWDLQTRKAQAVLGTRGPFRAVEFVGKDRLLAVTDNTVRLADRHSWEVADLSLNVNIIHAAVTLDETAVVLVGQQEYAGYRECLGLPRLKRRWIYREDRRYPPFRLCLCPDGYLIQGGINSAELLDPQTGELLDEIAHYSQAVPALAVSPDGKLLAVAAGTNLQLCELPRGRQIGTARTGGRKHFTDVAFHPSGRWLAATSNQETVRVFDTSMAEVVAFDWKIGPVRQLAFAPDGMRAAAASKTGKVVIWDMDL